MDDERIDLQKRDEYIQKSIEQLSIGRQIMAWLDRLWWRLFSRTYRVIDMDKGWREPTAEEIEEFGLPQKKENNES